MAQYWTDFSEYTLNEQPNDWTQRWVTADDWEVISVVGAEGGQVLEHDSSSSARRLLTWDEVPDSADVDIRVKARQQSTTGNQIRVHGRASGAAGDETSYWVETQGSDNFRLARYTNGGGLVTIGSHSFTFPTTTWIGIRLRIEGSNLRAKIWNYETDDEPENWQIDETDTAITGAAWVGVGNFTYSQARNWDYFSIGTDGDEPPPVPPDIFLEGIIDARSETLSDLSVAKSITVTINSDSDLVADTQLVLALSPELTANSILQAKIISDYSLGGDILGLSDAKGQSVVLRGLESRITAETDIISSLFVDIGLSGHIQAQSVIISFASILRAITGQIDGISQIGSEVAISAGLDGLVSSQSDIDSLFVRDVGYSGTINAFSSLTADLIEIVALVFLSGDIAGTSFAKSNIGIIHPITSTTIGQSESLGRVSIVSLLESSIIGKSQLPESEIDLLLLLKSQIEGTSNITGDIIEDAIIITEIDLRGKREIVQQLIGTWQKHSTLTGNKKSAHMLSGKLEKDKELTANSKTSVDLKGGVK